MATFVLLLGLMPVMAQHGGGHASVGGHSGFSGGHAGFSGGHGGFTGHSGFGGHAGAGNSFGGVHSGSGMHSSSGMHSGSGLAPHSLGRGSSFNRTFSARGRDHTHRGPRIRTRGFLNDCFGCGWGFGFPYYPYLGGGIDPYWWWDSGSSYDEDREREINQANEMNTQSLDEQRAREQGDQDAYAQSAPAPPRDEERSDPAPATVLVFRDQHKLEVQNYAIVGQTLWTFAPQHTQKIPLSDLDLPATIKANDDRGVDFRLPGAHEGQ